MTNSLLSGCETSSTQDTSRLELSTSEASRTCIPPISLASRSATSSPASVSGATRFAAPAGPMIDLFGPVPVLANLSPTQARALRLMTSGTSGPTGSTSLRERSRALSLSLASKLRPRTDLLGSTLFTLTWKERSTPSGRLICALRGSARRTSDNGCSSWGTPTKDEAGGTPEQFLERKTKLGGACGVSLTALNLQAQLASWATPATRDFRSASGSQEFLESRAEQPRGKPLSEQAFTLAHWPTTTTQDSKDSRAYGYGGQTFMTLTDAARSAEPGPMLNGSTVETTNGGQLNPAHSRWLMSLPPVWCACAPIALKRAK
jgi:hypothetical protein